MSPHIFENSQITPRLFNGEQSDLEGILINYYGIGGPLIVSHPDLDRSHGLFTRVDAHFWEKLSSKYGLEEKEVEALYLTSLKHADDLIIMLIRQSLPEGMENVYGLKNEVAVRPDSPARKLGYYAKSKDKRERFEFERQLMLAEIASHFHSISRTDRMHTKIADVNDIFTWGLFENDPEGKYNKGITIRAIHDNLTNQFLGEATDILRASPSQHIKNHYFQTRYIPGVGRVLTQPRKKSDVRSIMKALEIARKSGENSCVDPYNGVLDSCGFIFVVVEPEGNLTQDEAISTLTEKVKCLLIDNLGEELLIKDDSKINSTHSASGGIDWNRYQIKLPNWLDPVELVFQKLGPSIDYRFYVGDMNDPTVKNRAHKIYEVKRAQEMFRFLFPPDIYDFSDLFDVEILMANKMKEVVLGLLNFTNSYVNLEG